MIPTMNGPTLSIPPYTITACASAGVQSISVTATVENTGGPPVENTMLWLNGQLIAQDFDHAGQYWLLDNSDPTRSLYTIVLNRSTLANTPGPAIVSLGIWSAAGGIAFIDLPVTLPPVPLPAVSPRIVRTLFNCDPSTIQSTPGLLTALLAAGVNTLTFGCFHNPADSPSLTTFALWDADRVANIQPRVDWAKANGFAILTTGDDFLRTPGERAWINTTPWAAQAIAATAVMLAGTVGLEAVDEQGGAPTDDPAYARFVSAWRTAGGPPIAWPNQAPYVWETPAWSDYDSRYWSTTEWRNGRADGPTLSQQAAGIVRAAAQVTRPWLCELSCSGPFYTKTVAGGDYTPPSDTLQNGGVRASDCVAQAWLAMAYGASGIRAYAYDWPQWQAERAGPIGSTDLQTGSRPGDARWPGVSAAFNSIAKREAVLLGQAYAPVRVAQWVIGRREGLTFAVNTADTPVEALAQTCTIITPAGEALYTGDPVPPGGVIILENT